jgi:rod shape-determining protein MreD
MARVLFALLLFLAAMVQTVLLPSWNLIEVLPDLTLVLLLVWSALRGVREGLFWAFGLGLFIDVLALDPMGANALALLPVVLLGGLPRRRFFHSNLVFPIVVAVGATLAHGLVLLLLRSSDGAGLPMSSAFRVIFLQSLLNAMVVPPLYVVAGWMERRMVTSHA